MHGGRVGLVTEAGMVAAHLCSEIPRAGDGSIPCRALALRMRGIAVAECVVEQRADPTQRSLNVGRILSDDELAQRTPCNVPVVSEVALPVEHVGEYRVRQREPSHPLDHRVLGLASRPGEPRLGCLGLRSVILHIVQDIEPKRGQTLKRNSTTSPSCMT